MGDRGWQMEGWTENYIRARAVADSPRWNQIDSLVLLRDANAMLIGEFST